MIARPVWEQNVCHLAWHHLPTTFLFVHLHMVTLRTSSWIYVWSKKLNIDNLNTASTKVNIKPYYQQNGLETVILLHVITHVKREYISIHPSIYLSIYIYLSQHVLSIYLSIYIYLSQHVSGFYSVMVCYILPRTPLFPQSRYDISPPFPPLFFLLVNWVSFISLSYFCRFIPSHSLKKPLVVMKIWSPFPACSHFHNIALHLY